MANLIRTLHNVSDKFEKDNIEFNEELFEVAETALNGVMDNYAVMKSEAKVLQRLMRGDFQGEAAEAIKALLEIIPKYLNDYEHSIKDFKEAVRIARQMSQEIKNAPIIREIENY